MIRPATPSAEGRSPTGSVARGSFVKVAIVGAGAIGAFVGLRLAFSGEEVTFIARGANLEALRARGVKLISADGKEEVASNVRATDDYAAAGPQDLVILAIKAHQVEAVANEVPKLFGPHTIVVPMQNGIPYWYFFRPGRSGGHLRPSVDPNGTISREFSPSAWSVA